MDENKLRFGVGVLVIASIGTAIILTFLFGAFPAVLAREYSLNVRFPSAEGVSTNTPVLRDGVKIGRVSNIELLPEGGVLLTLSMDQNQQLSHRYVPRIGVGSFITGEAKLEFVRADQEQLTRVYEGQTEILEEAYEDGEFLSYGDKASDPFSILFGLEDEMRDTMLSVRSAGQAVAQASGRVDQLGSEFQQVIRGSEINVEGVVNQASQTLEEFQLAIQDVRRLINDPAIGQTTESLPEILEEAKASLQLAQESFRSLAEAGDRFEEVGASANRVAENAEKVVINVERFTRPFGDQGEQIAGQALTTLENLDRTLVQVEAFGRLLNQNDGTVRRLLEDEDLYWSVRRTIENVEQATARIRPILDDVRVFSDKIARDPRQLGVRGALNNTPNGAGFK